MEQREITSSQHIKDFKLVMEYKHVMKMAPPGVYILPEFDNIRVFHGVIFIRRGFYKDAIFRFRIDLPPEYNDINTVPKITFTPPVFNPFIHSTTGELDLTIEESMKNWNPEKNFLITALTFMKKAFYHKSYDQYSFVPNEEARKLFLQDRDQFFQQVLASVEQSQKRVYDIMPNNCTMVFTEPKPAHEETIKHIIYRYQQELAMNTNSNITNDRMIKADDDNDLSKDCDQSQLSLSDPSEPLILDLK